MDLRKVSVSRLERLRWDSLADIEFARAQACVLASGTTGVPVKDWALITANSAKNYWELKDKANSLLRFLIHGQGQLFSMEEQWRAAGDEFTSVYATRLLGDPARDLLRMKRYSRGEIDGDCYPSLQRGVLVPGMEGELAYRGVFRESSAEHQEVPFHFDHRVVASMPKIGRAYTAELPGVNLTLPTGEQLYHVTMRVGDKGVLDRLANLSNCPDVREATAAAGIYARLRG